MATKLVRASFNTEVVFYDEDKSETVICRVGEARVMKRLVADTFAHLLVKSEDIADDEVPAATVEDVEEDAPPADDAPIDEVDAP